MNRETYVSVPQPCHENWDAMTPQDQGRYCTTCAKTVIDFSRMTDTQVLNYLSQSNRRLCGRFAQEQLERPLIPVRKEKKKIWWMAALMPLTLLLNKVNAQQKASNKDVPATDKIIVVQSFCTKRKPFKPEEIQLLTNTIHGNVKDEHGNPLPFTSVSTIDNHSQTTTDEQGNFYLKLINPQPDSKLLISNIAYEQKEIPIDLNDTLNIVLKEKQTVLPEVCAKFTESYLSGRLGGLVVVTGYAVRRRPVKKIDTVKTTVRKILRTNPFKVYPNPAIRGNTVQIEVKKEGHYSIQLLDVSSKLISHSLFDAEKGATVTSLMVPSSATPGMYFIRLINDDTRQQFTDKIIVQ